MNNPIIEFIFTWQDGRKEVRYRRLKGSIDANKMISEIFKLQERGKLNGYTSPYSYQETCG